MKAEVHTNPEDETRPFSSVKASAESLRGHGWNVGYESQYGPLGDGRSGWKTHWSFRSGGEERLAIDGVIDREEDPRDDPTASLDEAEEFARAVAEQVGWRIEAPDA
jgi:hypothetical protein